MGNKIMQNYLDLFKNYVTVKNSGSVYLMHIRHFLEFCQKENIDILQFKYQDMEKFMLMLRAKNASSGYINNYIKAIRNLYKCLNINKIVSLPDFLFREIKLLKCERKKRPSLTQEELDDIIDMGMSFCGQMQPYKIKILLYFMYFTGIRRGELLRLKRIDIDLKTNSAIIKLPVKNKEEGIILFPEKLSKMLEEYFKREPETINAFNITKSQLLYLAHQLKAYTPAGKKFYPHILRHSFGDMLARNRIDIRVAQKLLRHKNINTTIIYYDPDLETVKEIYNEKIKIK
jgi:integrase/recombinase XerD